MQPFRLPVALLLVGATLFPAAIGSRASSSVLGPDTPLPAASGPHTAAYTEIRLHSWPRFPLHVYFVPDDNYTEKREEWACRGFDRWVTATDGFVDYDVCDTREKAQILVRFAPRTSNGVTEQQFRGKTMHAASITIGVREGAGKDMEAVAAHEFGHALGIGGHSEEERDLMYPVHYAGRPCHITERDLNTLAAAYPALAKRLARREPSELP